MQDQEPESATPRASSVDDHNALILQWCMYKASYTSSLKPHALVA
jgi:hypothetical protein